MSCATLAVWQSGTRTHDLVPRGRANNKQTSTSSITLYGVVDRVRIGSPAVHHRASSRVGSGLCTGEGPSGYSRVQANASIDGYAILSRIRCLEELPFLCQ
jgi:hypothetical protein